MNDLDDPKPRHLALIDPRAPSNPIAERELHDFDLGELTEHTDVLDDEPRLLGPIAGWQHRRDRQYPHRPNGTGSSH